MIGDQPHYEEIVLHPHEVQSPIWQKLVTHANRRLAVLRGRNDGDLDERKTAKLRGRIAELKVFLALGELSTPEHEADD